MVALVSVSTFASSADNHNAYKNTFTAIVNNSNHPVKVRVDHEYGSSFFHCWTNGTPISAGYSTILKPGDIFKTLLVGTPISRGFGYESSETIFVGDANHPGSNSVKIYTSLGETASKIAKTTHPVGSLGAKVTSQKDTGPNGMQFSVQINPY